MNTNIFKFDVRFLTAAAISLSVAFFAIGFSLSSVLSRPAADKNMSANGGVCVEKHREFVSAGEVVMSTSTIYLGNNSWQTTEGGRPRTYEQIQEVVTLECSYRVMEVEKKK